jgi:hypothetical protein
MKTVTIWHNLAVSPAVPEHRAGFLGYKPGQPLMRVARYTVPTDEIDALTIAQAAFHTFNVGDDPEFGAPDPKAVEYRKRKNRSLSVGDVVQVDQTWLACASAGWSEIEAPAWVVIDTYGSGPLPTLSGT